MLIVQTAIEKCNQHETVIIVGQDIDLLVLCIALAPQNKDIRFLRDAQGNIKERIYSSSDLQSSNVLQNCKETALFAHAFSGCDTTSALFGKGKAQTITLLNNRNDLADVVSVFNNPESTKEEVATAGERFMLALYKAPKKEKSLNHQRFLTFNNLVGQSSNAVILSRLPPTSAACRQHSYRVFHQTQLWRGVNLDPTEWGWKKIKNILSPVYTTEAPAPSSILKLISCNCKMGCGRRCGCAKVGLRCSTMCSMCNRQGCLNSPTEDEVMEEDPTDE